MVCSHLALQNLVDSTLKTVGNMQESDKIQVKLLGLANLVIVILFFYDPEYIREDSATSSGKHSLLTKDKRSPPHQPNWLISRISRTA